jgi:small subunit ribosomal protein S20
MPITRSAKKALRQNIQRRARNLARKRLIDAAIKEYKRAAAAGDPDKAGAKLPLVYKLLDKAAKTGYLKKNAAARKKSRLAKLLRSKV